ncbi:MAG: NAD(+) diphosphatase [Spirochaetaceae bacterium]|jgi:NAD+ diphosphatase|nr:NAD(+) diphosphatase [Spirochaetaceae bacterium]
MDEQNPGNIFIFTRQGQMVVPIDFPSDAAAALEDGICFDERIMHDFGALIHDRLFRASDPDGREWFSVLLLPADEPPPVLLPEGFRAEPLRSLIHGFAYNRALRMYHLAQWREESRYCGRCGHLNGEAAHGEYARLCPRCGRKEFPRISPAILVLIKNEQDEVLLAHNVNFKDNVYSLIAGFMEAGENLQNTVTREVREEVGIEIRDITFGTSQSWPFPDSLMVGFEARYQSGVVRCDKKEIADAQWFSRDHLPELPGKGSVSRFLIDKWRGETRAR